MSKFSQLFDHAQNKPLARRKFLQVLGLGAATAVFGRLLTACGGSDSAASSEACGSTANADVCYEFSVTIGDRTFKVIEDNPHGHEMTINALSGTIMLTDGSHGPHELTYDIDSLNEGQSEDFNTTLEDGHQHKVTFTRTA